MLAFSGGSAMAADLAARSYTKAPAIADAVYSWTGFYVGVNIGGHWGQDSDPAFIGFDNDFFPAARAMLNQALPNTLSPSGIAGGIHGGYNWQVSNFLVGVEADFDGLSGSRTRVVSGDLGPPGAGNTFQFTDTANDRWISTVRARVGVLAANRLLIFATGGVAFSSWRLSHGFIGGPNLFIPPVGTSSDVTRTGWAAGGGVEYALNNSWLIRAEYLHAGFGKTTSLLNAPAGPFNTQFVYPETLSENLARVGVSYKFGGPVVAKF